MRRCGNTALPSNGTGVVSRHPSQLRVTAVAERAGFGLFAAAPGDGFRFFDFDFDGGEGRAFVGAIAERLGFGKSAGAPPIGAGFHFLNEGRFLGDVRFIHEWFVTGQNVVPQGLFKMFRS